MERICKVTYEALTGLKKMAALCETDPGVCPVDTAQKIAETAVKNSCGKGVMCRDGLRQIWLIVTDITKGNGSPDDLEMLEELLGVIRECADCELSFAASDLILQLLTGYQENWRQHVVRKNCKALVCQGCHTVHIDAAKCQGSGTCREVCPEDAIAGGEGLFSVINQEVCTRCDRCVEVCPGGAISKAGAVKPQGPKEPGPVGSFAGAGGRRGRRGSRGRAGVAAENVRQPVFSGASMEEVSIRQKRPDKTDVLRVQGLQSETVETGAVWNRQADSEGTRTTQSLKTNVKGTATDQNRQTETAETGAVRSRRTRAGGVNGAQGSHRTRRRRNDGAAVSEIPPVPSHAVNPEVQRALENASAGQQERQVPLRKNEEAERINHTKAADTPITAAPAPFAGTGQPPVRRRRRRTVSIDDNRTSNIQSQGVQEPAAAPAEEEQKPVTRRRRRRRSPNETDGS